MNGVAGDSDARRDLDARIYAPAQGLEALDADLWAAIQRSPDDDEVP